MVIEKLLICHNISGNLTVKRQNFCLRKTTIRLSKIEYAYVFHSNTVPTGRRFGQCSAVPECAVQTSLGLRISLARALSGELPLGVIAQLTRSLSLTRTRFDNIALGRGRPVFKTWGSA